MDFCAAPDWNRVGSSGTNIEPSLNHDLEHRTYWNFPCFRYLSPSWPCLKDPSWTSPFLQNYGDTQKSMKGPSWPSAAFGENASQNLIQHMTYICSTHGAFQSMFSSTQNICQAHPGGNYSNSSFFLVFQGKLVKQLSQLVVSTFIVSVSERNCATLSVAAACDKNRELDRKDTLGRTLLRGHSGKDALASNLAQTRLVCHSC